MVIGLGVAIVLALISVVVLLQDIRKEVNIALAVAIVAINMWVVGIFLLQNEHWQTIEYARFIFTIGLLSLMFLFWFFCALFRDFGSVTPAINRVSNILIFILAIAAVITSTTDFVVKDIIPKSHSIPTPILNDGIIGYGAVLIATLVTIGMFIVLFSGKLTKNQKAKLKIVSFTIGIAVLTAAATNLIFPIILDNVEIVNLTPLSATVVSVGLSYAIVRHGLFDIKLAAVRSAAYFLSLLTLAGMYYAIAYVISISLFQNSVSNSFSLSPLNIFLALGLAFIFQPIKKFFDQITNDIFYRSNYRSEDFFADFSMLLTSTIDLRGLLQRASEQIADTFKAEQALFFLHYTKDTEHHMSAGTRGHARLPLYDTRLLDEYVATSSEKGIFMTELLDDDAITVRRMLRSHKIAVVMPLLHGEEITGYVMLGDHRSGNYTKRDLTVLSTVSNELVIAIQNALSLHEVKELNATLQQRINVATKELRSSNAQLKHLDEIKDEFMSMASHQLRTPLTSIKGYLSMVLEGDAGKITPQQHKVLLEAFNSSERMVRLIADFLNVSRLQTGKFIIDKAPFDMNKVVGDEVRILDMIARTHDVRLRFNAAKESLPVVADEQKIRQVVMNFIDNAIYYSNPKGTIVINVEKVKNEVALTVVDTGIGVPVEEQARLFTKFFRAGNARKQRPDGTGVGLYLARRVINGHNGSIIFSSKEGRGSTFGFRLPLSKVPLPVARPKPVEAKTELVSTK